MPAMLGAELLVSCLRSLPGISWRRVQPVQAASARRHGGARWFTARAVPLSSQIWGAGLPHGAPAAPLRHAHRDRSRHARRAPSDRCAQFEIFCSRLLCSLGNCTGGDALNSNVLASTNVLKLEPCGYVGRRSHRRSVGRSQPARGSSRCRWLPRRNGGVSAPPSTKR